MKNYSKPISIGGVQLQHNVILSSMVDVTDAPFRRLCAQGGSALVSGDRVESAAILQRDSTIQKRLSFFPDEHPIRFQLAGSDPVEMAEAAKVVAASGADMIDVNATCPLPKVVRTHSGAALLKDEKRFAGIMEAVVAAVSIPVTLKIQMGLRENDLLAPALATLAEACGVSLLVVQARSASKRQAGKPDWAGVGQVTKCVSIPVIGNGGVETPEDAAEFLEAAGCAGVAVDHAAVSDPTIFNRIHHYFVTGEKLPLPTRLQRFESLWHHVEWTREMFGERTALLRMQKFLPYYVEGFPLAWNSGSLRSIASIRCLRL